MTTIAVTGANGFVGSALLAELKRRGYGVRGIFRSGSADDTAEVGDIGPGTDWTAALAGVDVVIHCAARVHVMQDDATDPLAEFRHVNSEGTRCLAMQAAECGVQRLVFVSTIKVNGEATGSPQGSREKFTAFDTPDPADPYAISKWEAETLLREVAANTGLEIVVVRPPLAYGPGVGGNFRSLITAVDRGWPLPFGRVDNRRSLVALPNLVDLLAVCATHRDAAGQTFLVSDGDDLSTPELARRLARAIGRSARILPVPVSLLRLAGKLTGQGGKVDRLIGSLQVDIDHTSQKLQWQPKTSVDEGLRKAVGAG